MGKSFIHYEPDRVDFTLSGHELDSIVNLSNSSAKDFAIGLLAFGASCGINAWSAISSQNPFAITASIFLNLFGGSLGLILGTFFLITWLRTRQRASVLLASIKNKPRFEVPSFTNQESAAGAGAHTNVPPLNISQPAG